MPSYLRLVICSASRSLRLPIQFFAGLAFLALVMSSASAHAGLTPEYTFVTGNFSEGLNGQSVGMTAGDAVDHTAFTFFDPSDPPVISSAPDFVGQPSDVFGGSYQFVSPVMMQENTQSPFYWTAFPAGGSKLSAGSSDVSISLGTDDAEFRIVRQAVAICALGLVAVFLSVLLLPMAVDRRKVRQRT